MRVRMEFSSFRVQNTFPYFSLCNTHPTCFLINVMSLPFVAAIYRKDEYFWVAEKDLGWKDLGYCCSISLWWETPSTRKRQYSLLKAGAGWWAGNVQWNYTSIDKSISFFWALQLTICGLILKKKQQQQQQPTTLSFVAVFGLCLGSRVNRSHEKHVHKSLQWCKGSAEQYRWPHTWMCSKGHSLNFGLSASKVVLVANLTRSLGGWRGVACFGFVLLGFLNCNTKTTVVFYRNLTSKSIRLFKSAKTVHKTTVEQNSEWFISFSLHRCYIVG